jgi:hypothetical protein
MKSVTLVAFIGSWFCSSLTSRLRKSADVIAPFDAAFDDEEDEFPFGEPVEETVMGETPAAGTSARRVGRGAMVISSANQTRGAPNSGAETFGGMH